MANIPINQIASHNFQTAETITEAKTLTKSDCGKVFYITQGDYDITLPKLSDSMIGWHAFLIIATSANNALDLVPTSGDEGTIEFLHNRAGGDFQNKNSVIFAASGSSDPAGALTKIFCYDKRTSTSGDKVPRWNIHAYSNASGDTYTSG